MLYLNPADGLGPVLVPFRDPTKDWTAFMLARRSGVRRNEQIWVLDSPDARCSMAVHRCPEFVKRNRRQNNEVHVARNLAEPVVEVLFALHSNKVAALMQDQLLLRPSPTPSPTRPPHKPAEAYAASAA